MKRKSLTAVFLLLFVWSGASALYADAVEAKIHATLNEIVRLGGSPQPSEEDQQKMRSLYAQMKAYGLNAVPVLQEVLESQDNVFKKKAALYVVQDIYAPASVEDMAFKQARAMKYYKIAAKDASVDVRALALDLISRTNTDDTFSALREIYQNDPDVRLRIAALSRIAYYRMPAAEKVLEEAAQDSESEVQKAALQYKASRAADMEKYKAENADRVETPSVPKKYGKNA